MVHLTLTSSKGNSGSRFFPSTGYLALTPVKVEGVVHTVLDDDAKPLPAKSLTIFVRCYESRIGRVGAILTNVLATYSEVLWKKSDHDPDWSDLGQAEFPFKILVPVSNPGQSTAYFQDYRIFWRVEAVIQHAHMVGVGSRLVRHFELPLIRYDLPPIDALSSLPSSDSHFRETTKPRAPVIRYQLTTPTSFIGPSDLVSIPLVLQPLDPSVVIRSIGLIVERRIEVLDPPTSDPTISSHSPSQHHTGLNTPNLSRSSSASAATSAASSTATLNLPDGFSERRPLLAGAAEPTTTKVATASVAAAESMGPFARNDQGLYLKTLTLQWPSSKSTARWAIGQTMRTSLVNVRYVLRVKVIVSSAHGTESIDLEEREIYIVCTNDAERRLAMAKYADSRSKSKSPRRSKRSGDHIADTANSLPSPPLSPATPYATHPLALPLLPLSASNSPGSSPYRPSTSSARTMTSSPRRPHTSAGPRDRDKLSRHGKESFRSRSERPDTATIPAVPLPRPTPVSAPTRARTSFLGPPTPGRIDADADGDVIATPSATVATGVGFESGEVRAWEEELERIEMQSSKSSVGMLGGKRRRRSTRGTPGSDTLSSSIITSRHPDPRLAILTRIIRSISITRICSVMARCKYSYIIIRRLLSCSIA